MYTLKVSTASMVWDGQHKVELWSVFLVPSYMNTEIPKILKVQRVCTNLMLIYSHFGSLYLSSFAFIQSIISFLHTHTHFERNHFCAKKIESFHLVNWFDTAFMVMYHSSFVVGMWSKLTDKQKSTFERTPSHTLAFIHTHTLAQFIHIWEFSKFSQTSRAYKLFINGSFSRRFIVFIRLLYMDHT